MKTLAIAFVLLFSLPGHADLLDRVHLENAIRDRLEQAVQLRDHNARVFARLAVRSVTEELPGTQALDHTEVTPTRLESSDISHLEIEIYTELDELPADLRDSLYTMLPVDRSKVVIKTRHFEPAKITPPQKTVEAKDIDNIAEKTVRSLSETLFAAVGAFVLFFAGGTWFYNSRRTREFREQITLLSRAISESSGGRYSANLPSLAAPLAASSTESPYNTLRALPLPSLKELFADCYWCEDDAYAHWLWKNLGSDQRASLLNAIPFMQEYSLAFVSVPARERDFHEHPFYLKPTSCSHLSMDALGAAVHENLGLWHQISPMRQHGIQIGLEKKLTAVRTAALGEPQWSTMAASPARILRARAPIGDVSVQDELLLFENPAMVPSELREDIRSLVWLAQRDDETIQRALARFDARSLAAAWVGPEAVLKKLEENLPEKKLRMLETYRGRTAASRHSDAYQALFEEGLRDEVA